MTGLRPRLLAAALVAALALAATVLLSRTDDGEALVFTAHARLRGQALLARVRQDPPAVLLFGDSLVEATAIDRLCDRPALAAGAWGARLAEIAEIAPAVVAAARPRTVVVAVGVNDTRRHAPTDPEAFRTAYRRLLAPWREAGIELVLATLAPVVAGRPLGDVNFDPARIDRLNGVIRDLAAEVGARIAAFDTLPRAPGGGLDPTLSDDGVHLTPAGYRLWHAILEKAVCGPAESR